MAFFVSTTKVGSHALAGVKVGETKEGEDDGALVCEFGPLKRGLTTMIPGESRRFWISSDIKARLVEFKRSIGILNIDQC